MPWTDEQLAVINYDGTKPLLVVATAGSGKTTLLLGRIYRLIRDGVRPGDILMTTFSKRGAEDMRAKAVYFGIPQAVEFRTLHAAALRIISSGARDGVLYTVPESWKLRKIVRDTVRTCSSARCVPRQMLTPACVLRGIELAKAALIWPDSWSAESGDTYPTYIDWAHASDLHPEWAECVNACYRALETASVCPASFGFKESAGTQWITFSDMIARVARSAVRCDAVLDARIRDWRGAFRHVIVDEVQDNNLAQWIMARYLCSGSLVAVGDPQQSIYKFRGADPALMLEAVEKHGSEVAHLSTNWRSGREIIDVANNVLSKSRRLFNDEVLRLGRDGTVGEVTLCEFSDSREEANGIVEILKDHNACGVRFGEMAVLYRTNAYGGDIEMAFLRHGIPYVVSGRSLFESRLAKVAMGYITCADDPFDTAALKTIHTVPLRGLGAEFISSFPTLAAVRDAVHSGKSIGRWKNSAVGLVRDVDAIANLLRAGNISGALRHVFDKVGVQEHFVQEAEDYEDQNDVKDLCSALCGCAASLGSYAKLREVFRLANGKSSDLTDGPVVDAVTLSTVHRSKGLQWRTVFCAGVSCGHFPHRLGDRDEEFRLGYVAFTRACDSLFISWTSDRGPSPLVLALKSDVSAA